jgi:hypothetical protein
MYVRHSPRYTGFGLGQDQSVVPAPLVAFGQPINWTDLLIVAGLGAFFFVVFSGTRKVRSYGSSYVEKKKKKASRVKSAREALEVAERE